MISAAKFLGTENNKGISAYCTGYLPTPIREVAPHTPTLPLTHLGNSPPLSPSSIGPPISSSPSPLPAASSTPSMTCPYPFSPL